MRPAINLPAAGLALIYVILAGTPTPCNAQPATVSADELPVHSSSSAKSSVVGSLKSDERVTVGLAVDGNDGNWCEITRSSPPPELSGFVSCDQLKLEPVPAPSYSTPAAPRAAEPIRNADAAIREAIRLSGIGQAILQLRDPSPYLDMLPTKRLTQQQVADVKALVIQTMRPEKFEAAVTAALKGSYPAENYPQLLALLRAPIARQMETIEQQQLRPDPEALKAFVAGLNQTPPDAQHLAIVRRIDQVTGTSQLMVDIVAAVIEGMAAGSGQISETDLNKALQVVRDQRGDALRQAALVHLLYVYRNVPDDQLVEYARVLADPLMVRFTEVAGGGLVVATREASAAMMQAMMRRFPIGTPPAAPRN